MTLRTVWKAEDGCPELLRQLMLHESWVKSALEVFETDLPAPRAHGAFASPPFYRPPGSYRSFYYCPSLANDMEGRGPVLAFKGFEPGCDGLDELLGDLRRPCYSPHNIAEHLIFEENKIPGALSYIEAAQEAARAADIQAAHLQRYGHLARLPVPLRVFRHEAAVEQGFFTKLRSHLSTAARERVEALLLEGLGACVYYYGSPPIRARDVETMLEGLSFQRRTFALLGLCDPDEVVARWISCFARILGLGVLPGSLASYRTGICCQPQNACMDGGFVDLDSLTPLSSLTDDAAVQSALEFSTSALVSTVRALLTGSGDGLRDDAAAGRFDVHQIRHFVLCSVERALAVSGDVDPRVRAYFTPADSVGTLIERVSPYFGERDVRFAPASREFQPFASKLLAMARRG